MLDENFTVSGKQRGRLFPNAKGCGCKNIFFSIISMSLTSFLFSQIPHLWTAMVGMRTVTKFDKFVQSSRNPSLRRVSTSPVSTPASSRRSSSQSWTTGRSPGPSSTVLPSQFLSSLSPSATWYLPTIISILRRNRNR